MTSVERRLDGLTKDLTARERAILVMQHWLRGEEWDKALNTRVPEEQRAEYDRIVHAIEDANQSIHTQLVIEQLWLFEVEIKLGWLQSLAALTRRAEKLEAELKRRGVRVRRGRRVKEGRGKDGGVLLEPLPACERGLEWTMPRLWGKNAGEPDPPPSGEKLVEALLKEVRFGLEVRAQDLRAWRLVLGEMSEAFDGYNAAHFSVERDLAMLEDHIETLRNEVREFVDVELPLPTDVMVSVAREYVRLDDIRGRAAAVTTGGQQLESDYARRQREEANAKWREELEAESAWRDGEPEDVFVTGAEV